MLAIQRPRMGSSQPPDGNGPFGYSFMPDDSLFLEPPEPAPGEPLLTLEDDRALTSFFDQITSNQYSDMSFGEGLNFSDAWHGLPPQFMGTATSYGHHPPQPMSSSILDFADTNFNFQFGSTSMPPPPPPQPQRQAPPPPIHSPIEQGTSADAAAVLTTLHNGHHTQRSNSINHGPLHSSQPMRPPSSHSITQPRNHFTPERSSPAHLATIRAPVPLPEQHDENLFADMAFGTPRATSSHRGNQNPDDVRWGTDTSFTPGQGYAPVSDKETTEALANERLKYMECLKLSNSAANTRPASPTVNGDHSPVNARAGKANGHAKMPSFSEAPRRRRKSKAKGDAEDDDEDSASPPPKVARKRKSKVNLSGADDTASVNETPGKRRKSNANGSKPPRENLSDEQKRQNHILSEQKRRTLIKEGFEDLQEIIPNLKNGGYSKSAMLQLAGEWLDDLIKGNELLSR